MTPRARVLIVEDSPTSAAVLQAALESLGCETLTATDGIAALERVAAAAPDLVVLDILLPVLDGFEVLARLKADPATRDIPVIVISASQDLASVVSGIERGAEDWLPKPWDPVLLRARVRACLDKKRLRDQEVEYRRQVDRLAEAARSMEAGRWDASILAPVVERTDALGNLARVFERMVREVHAREQRLQEQLRQLQADIEERGRASTDRPAAYVPMDRRQALAAGPGDLPREAEGAALVADISGFTPLTETLARELGLQKGAEELTRQLDRVYGPLVDRVHRHRGSVIGFAGDAITCWFDADAPGAPPAPRRALACALSMQEAAVGESLPASIKVVVVAGRAQRWLVGDPAVQRVEVLAGALLDRLAAGAERALAAEVLAHESVGPGYAARAWREAGGTRFAVVEALDTPVPESPWPALDPEAVPDEKARPWLLPAVYERVRGGRSAFLSDLRPAAALFLTFRGIDDEAGASAGERLDAVVRWVQGVLMRHEGSLLQVTTGDKGTYLYACFGAPVAHADDAGRAVAAALELEAPPPELSFLEGVRLGLAYGQMRAGAYGHESQRTYGVLGDRVNVAARLMQAAEAGILCDEPLRQAAGAVARYVPLPPIAVKGKAEPVVAFRVLPDPARRDVEGRLDRLPPAYQLTLKVASVIGPAFDVDLLRSVHPIDGDRRHLEEHLCFLASLELVAPHDGSVERWAFRDHLTREAMYARLLFAQRRQLHRAVAEALEAETPAEAPAGVCAEVARHWRAAEDPGRAIAWLERAAQRARDDGAYDEAVGYVREALELGAGAPAQAAGRS